MRLTITLAISSLVTKWMTENKGRAKVWMIKLINELIWCNRFFLLPISFKLKQNIFWIWLIQYNRVWSAIRNHFHHLSRIENNISYYFFLVVSRVKCVLCIIKKNAWVANGIAEYSTPTNLNKSDALGENSRIQGHLSSKWT